MKHFSREDDTGVALIRIGAEGSVHLTAEAAEELEQLIQELEADASVRAVVFTGRNPGYFIQHYSVEELVGLSNHLRSTGFEANEVAELKATALDRSIRHLETIPKPVIAAINGNCMGGGFEFALGADIRIAEDGPYTIGLPEVNLAILPGAGGTQRLARLIGIAAALDLVLEGRVLSPQEAARRGLVGECVNGPVLVRAMERARQLAALDQRAVGHIKRLIRSTQDLPMQEGLKLERNLFLDLAARDSAFEKMGAFTRGEIQITSDLGAD